jgi:hypothetical protein
VMNENFSILYFEKSHFKLWSFTAFFLPRPSPIVKIIYIQHLILISSIYIYIKYLSLIPIIIVVSFSFFLLYNIDFYLLFTLL